MSGFLSWWTSHFTPMLSWWQWLLVLAVPPAVLLLYFLKLKRQPLEVPSTYLWRKSIEDLHVNSIWQRLRQSLLLFLQLLILALAILALLRPGWRGSKLVGDRFIFLVDNSASMKANDVAESRLNEAKRRVAELIDQMRSGDVAMIVSFSDSARVEQLFTDNRRELRRRLDAIQPTNRSTSLREALNVSAGLANPGRAAFSDLDTKVAESLPATLYIYSDGKFADVQGFSLGNLKPVYVPIGRQDSRNIGITSFAVQQAEGRADRSQAFARIENYGSPDARVAVTLERDGHVIDADEVEVKANEATGIAFDLDDSQTGTLEARISPGGDLPSDDRAWTVVAPPRKAKVLLVTAGNDALEFALGTPRATELAEVSIASPAVLGTKEHEQLAAGGSYDLVIYDQCQPKGMPQANTLFIGRLPPLADWGYVADKPAEKLAAPQVIDVETAHPLMQLIDLGNVTFAEAIAMKLPPGGTTLIDTNRGVLFAVAPREGFEDAVLASEIVGTNEQGEKYANTDWPLRLSFPVFVMNAIEYLGGTRQAAGAGSVAPGRLVTLRTSTNAERLTVRAPGGQTAEISRTRGGTFNYADAEQLGVYQVLENGQPKQAFAVNLFDSAESDIRPRPENSIKIGYVEVAGQGGLEGTRRELWRPLLLAALFVLVAEWYIYNRRVYI
jgi:hypothetical protein